MASLGNFPMRACAFLLYKFPLVDALSLLMLFGERAQKESNPPIHPKLVYAYVIACIGCGVLLSSGIKQKAACLMYAGQMLYFAVNFYTNPKWQYTEWQRTMLSLRQIGVLGTYVMLAYIVDKKRSTQLLRIGQIALGIFLMATVFLINSVPQYREAFSAHMMGGDYMRYLIAVTLAGCALSFFSGYFLHDMSMCAAVTLLLTTAFVDCDLPYWRNLGVHQWGQIRQILNSACAILGLFYLSFSVDNQLKAD
ncbi:transmembrane protein 101-like [Littorina saxatilis]|uniref:Uncharacterized protein n=1 Tax=Littorina saxatilis TaxID=31220 RepID=A0AAN9B505_9CAEN